VNRPADPLPNLFARAASLLLGDNPQHNSDPDPRLLLEALGYATAAEFSIGESESSPETLNRACLLKAASRFGRVFELAAPEAPGLVCFGAEFDPGLADPLHAGHPLVGASGVGLSLQDAFQGSSLRSG
jgi:ribosomal protein S12 methylthiotransferase accessory factor